MHHGEVIHDGFLLTLSVLAHLLFLSFSGYWHHSLAVHKITWIDFAPSNNIWVEDHARS